MEVVDHEPHGWYLLEDAGCHYLDVNCSLPLVDISILVQLDTEEEAELHGLGRTFVMYLAAKISYWPDRYQPRNVKGAIADQVAAAITSWQRR